MHNKIFMQTLTNGLETLNNRECGRTPNAVKPELVTSQCHQLGGVSRLTNRRILSCIFSMTFASRKLVTFRGTLRAPMNSTGEPPRLAAGNDLIRSGRNADIPHASAGRKNTAANYADFIESAWVVCLRQLHRQPVQPSTKAG